MKKLIVFIIFFASFCDAHSQLYLSGLNFTIQSNDSVAFYYKKGNDILRFRSTKINNTTTYSKLEYSNNNFVNTTLINEWTIDTATFSNYRWYMADKIANTADSLSSILNITSYIRELDSMTFYVSDTISGATLGSELYQHLFYHNSVVRSIYRGPAGGNDVDTCSCTSYIGYVVKLSSFRCLEDMILHVNQFKSYLTDSIDAVRRYNVEYLISYLASYDGDSISVFKIFNKIFVESGGQREAPILAPFPCPWLSGTACGCCGNYQGPCLMCAVTCLTHDFICWRTGCRPRWYCFSGCQPTPCWTN